MGDNPPVSSNLELVRSIFADWERSDYSAVDWADPEIEFALADGPDPESWTGVAGMAEGWYAFKSTWEDFRAEPQAYRDLDHEHVLVLVQFNGRAETSGLDLAQMHTQQASLFQIRDRKVTRLILYFDGDRALADLGLTPDKATPSPRSTNSSQEYSSSS
jgi:ketosteroid isomerase-like protein